MKLIFIQLSTIIISLSLAKINAYTAVDPNGYIVYCPCMGKIHRLFDLINSWK